MILIKHLQDFTGDNRKQCVYQPGFLQMFPQIWQIPEINMNLGLSTDPYIEDTVEACSNYSSLMASSIAPAHFLAGHAQRFGDVPPSHRDRPTADGLHAICAKISSELHVVLRLGQFLTSMSVGMYLRP